MKCLITGGQGFVGHNLIHRLRERFLNNGTEPSPSDSVIVSVDNLSTGNEEHKWKHPDIFYHTFDVVRQNLKELHFIPDVIFHLAATARIQPSFQFPAEVVHNNIESTINVLEFARLNGNIPVIFAGSSSIHTGYLENPYTFSKAMCEDACRLYSKLYDVPTTITRFYNVYGPYMIDGTSPYATVLSIFEKQCMEGGPFIITSDGEQRRDFTHVNDICDGLIACIGRLNDRAEEFEFGRGENYSINEIVTMFDPNGKLERVYVSTRLGEARDTLTLSEKARKELGYNPTGDVEEFILVRVYHSLMERLKEYSERGVPGW